MSPERWQRVKDLFAVAAERDPGEQEAFLAEACGGDDELRREVEALLLADREPATVFDRPVAEILRGMPAPGPATGRRFGAYRVTGEVGRGGMAVVYAAVRDDDQYKKQVAIKLIKRGMDTDAIVARFRQERQILANLEHPNIARLLDGGVSDDGLPYLVMEHIEGVPIEAYCDRHGLGTDARLRLFRTVCAAVHAAHRSLVVHRDLKPSNILVTGAGEPKLLDFGIAKLIAPDGGLGSRLATVAGTRPMTPRYASPEQVRGEPITTASDVYALGVLLFELLTGHRPYRLESLAPGELERAICDQEPERPSAALDREVTVLGGAGDGGRAPATAAERVSRTRDGTPQRLRRKLAGDLDNIVLKAMHKVPERRYGSVEQLSEDIRRHLDGLPVIARRDTLAYRTGKFVRRHRLGVTAAILVFLSLVAGIVATAWQARVARAERATSEWVSTFLVDLFEISRPDRALGETVTARELLDRGAERIPRELGDQPEVRARLMDSIGFAYSKLGLYDRAAPLLEEALELRRRTLGAADPAVAVSLNHLGELNRARGRYPEAERLHRESLELRRERLGEGHELVAESLNDLALALYHQDRIDAAEPLLRRALEIRRRVHGDEHQEVATVLNNLGLVLKARGGTGEALALYREALAMNRRLLGDGHPDVAVNLNNLAETLRVRGDCEEAIGAYRETLELETRLLGARHPDLATTQNNLAGCLADLGEHEEAERLHRESLDLRRETLGGEHPDVAASLNNLGGLFFARGRLAEAEAFYREALALNRKIHGGEHPDVAKNLNNLAATLERKGDLDSAEGLYREALEVNRRLQGDEHRDVADNRHKLAELLLRRRELRQAELELRAVLATRRGLLGDEHRDVAQTLLSLGYALFADGRPAEAEPVLRQGLTLWRQWPAEEWKNVAATQGLLGSSLAALGRYAEAEPLLVDSYSAFRDRSGGHHSRTSRALRRIIELYEAWDRPDQAARYRSMLPQ